MNITDATGTCPRLETRETRGTPSDGRRGYTFRQKRATRQALMRPWLLGFSPPRLVLERFLIGAHAPRELLEAVRDALRSVSPDVLAFRVQTVMECDAREDLVRVRVPILYLQAEQDRLVAKSSFEEIQRLKPDTIFASIPAPHLLSQREPNKSAASIVHFLESLQK